ncbi:hypothetical protein [Mesorhizobium sp. BE184]|uniref:hypothetical protein n=1 Tax=Mesorhizobium sp. BE184 TaxID=2817714 RepID=UPI0028649191|nr:hypothetical protein [Mesorhizobium sp. BE184]MDR7032439.1 hypothetical protein [Mesorhizobium sp. BE184]
MATFQITGPNGKKYRVTGDDPAGAMAALKKAMGADASATVDPSTNQPQGVPAYVPPRVEGYNRQTGEVSPQIGMAKSAAYGAADTATAGFGDELASYPASWLSGVPRDQVLSEMRGNQAQAQEANPGSYLTGQIGGGVAQGLATGPASLTANLTSRATPLIGRVLAGLGDGAILGGLYGAGSGTDTESRLTEGVIGAGSGVAAGAAFPLIGAGASKAYEAGKNMLAASPIARQAGASPEALRLLGNVLNADGSLGVTGQANMARAGSDAMLADAGPNARSVLDTAIQRGGPGAIDARQAIADRTGRATQSVADALNATLGQPQGVTAARTAIRQGSASARSSAYDDAYKAAIDYADPRGQAIENIVKTRVPQSAINEANALMRAEGNSSKQILAHVADDGAVTFENLPDVRQLDYITRGLNEVADQADGAGKLGGTTAKGRAYSNLSQELRSHLKDLVPEYGKALETAADPIRRSKAIDLGSKLLSPSMTRDQVDEAVSGMTGPEKEALAQGVRSRLDDVMANVTRTVQDGGTDAREAIKAIKDLSSRANREKLTAAIGKTKAEALFDEIDRASMSFDLRASVAENSKTYARQATDRRISDMTQPGAIGKAAQGEPLKATKSIVQALTGMTPERIRGKEDAIYSEIARLLTRQGGAGQGIYDAIGKLGQTDQATKLMSDRIARALLGPKLSYPASTQAVTYTRE